MQAGAALHARSSSAPASTSSTCGRRTACSARDGHALAGVVHEARLFHAFARTAQSNVEVKGGNPLTENYSVLRPEVLSRFDGAALAQRNTQFVQTLLAADAVVIAGRPRATA